MFSMIVINWMLSSPSFSLALISLFQLFVIFFPELFNFPTCFLELNIIETFHRFHQVSVVPSPIPKANCQRVETRKLRNLTGESVV